MSRAGALTAVGARIATGPIGLEGAVKDCHPGHLPRREWELYLNGYMRGYADGIDTGRQQMNDEIATIQRTAADVVHRLARLPARDHEADRAAAERRNGRWRQ